MSGPKTYFLVPHYDFPADGPVRLGSLILDPQEPGESINEGKIVEISSPIYTSTKENWEQSIELSTNGRTGLWARCVNILGLGGNIGASCDATTVEHYQFRDLETKYFSPSPTYLTAACNAPGVRAFLKGTRYAPIYMVTSLKIVHGPDAEVTSRRSMAREGHANMGLHGLMGASPFALDAGDLSVRNARTATSSFDGSSDFVFAYRLGKITFSPDAEGVPIPKHQLHKVGAVLGVDEDGNINKRVGEFPRAVRFEGEEAILLELDEEKVLTAIDEDDEGECKCYIVQSA
jgi:hypothetical protein